MISQTFYNKNNLASYFLAGTVKHFPVKDSSVIIEWREYTLKAFETIYTVSKDVFGKDLVHLWTYIADSNPPRHPDDWKIGDVIKIPKIIVRDADTTRVIQ